MFHILLLLIKYTLGSVILPININKIPAKILLEYPNYQFMFHVDDRTYEYIDVFFKVEPINFQTALIINYENFPKIKRPKGYKYLHIVFLDDPLEFEVFSNKRPNLKHHDVILFIIKDFILRTSKKADQYNFWEQPGLKRAGSVIVYDYDNNTYQFVKFFDGLLSGKLQTIKTTEKVPKLLQYLNNFKNFHGHVFKVGYSPFPPYVWCNNSLSSKRCIPYGIEGNFLQTLSKYMNFNYRMESFKNRTPSPWPAMINAIHRGEIDWAIGAISKSEKRIRLVDFTEPLKAEGYVVLFSASADNLKNLNIILRPFKLSLWIFFIFILLLYSCTVHKITYQSVVEQPYIIRTKSLVLRILLLTWTLNAIIFSTAYKTNLASYMIKPTMTEPNSVKDLLNRNYYFQADGEDWSLLRSNLKESNNKVFEKVLTRIRDDLEICQAVRKLFGNKIAIIEEATPLQYLVLTTCTNVSLEYDISTLRFTGQELFFTLYAWPFQIGSPFRPKFSERIQTLHSTGLIHKWYKSAFKKDISKSNQQEVDLDTASLKMQSYLAPALMLTAGHIFSFLIFVYEIVYFKYYN